MKTRKIIAYFILVLLSCLPTNSMAQIFTDYQSNFKFDIPNGWTAKVFDDKPMRFIGLVNIDYKDDPILIVPHPIPEFQKKAKFYNDRTLLNWPDTELAKALENSIADIKYQDANNKILSAKIITNPNNKSIFIMYENNKNREIMAYTVINGIRYDIFVILDLPDSNKNTEGLVPIFLNVIKSIQPAY